MPQGHIPNPMSKRRQDKTASPGKPEVAPTARPPLRGDHMTRLRGGHRRPPRQQGLEQGVVADPLLLGDRAVAGAISHNASATRQLQPAGQVAKATRARVGRGGRPSELRPAQRAGALVGRVAGRMGSALPGAAPIQGVNGTFEKLMPQWPTMAGSRRYAPHAHGGPDAPIRRQGPVRASAHPTTRQRPLQRAASGLAGW
jgi:hypothetical protein